MDFKMPQELSVMRIRIKYEPGAVVNDKNMCLKMPPDLSVIRSILHEATES